MIPAPKPPAMATQPLQSQARQSYHPACEAAVNHQINLELYASYVYASMASYFESDQAVLRQVSQFFLRQSSQQTQHAQRLMRLQNERGGRTCLHAIHGPDQNHWESGLKTLERALRLAMGINQNLLSIHQLATEKNDARLSSFLEHNSLHEQVKSIQELRDHLTDFLTPSAPETGLAEHLLDKLTLDDKND